ncbi:MAG: 4-hydroxybenzoate 3-monooxygenase [Pseudomonadota bacterium]|jgi:p-hydroxybenzoate 3-monooxygenase
MRTEVGIVGAGPAGLLLSHMLAQAGIGSVIVEKRSRAYVEARLRAGLLEHNTIEIVNSLGLGDRMMREGLVHHGIEIRVDGRAHRIDIAGLTGGRRIMIYGQHELVTDLIAARLAGGGEIVFEAADVALDGLDGAAPRIGYTANGVRHEVTCTLIAGCDGFHGVSRPAIPSGRLRTFERDYPFGWLAIMAKAPPVSDELIYASHRRGFALYTMRSRTRARLYLQVPADEDIDDWSDGRIWDELDRRLEGGDGRLPPRGEIVQKSIAGMRSFVVEPMQYGNLFLAGDAAHIVPPTGAKGMNLAIADAAVLAEAIISFLGSGDRTLLDGYSGTCLRRVWRAEQFSWWMTAMLHRWPEDHPDAFDQRLRRAELEYLLSTETGARMLAENYAGLPLDWDRAETSR